MAETNDGGNGKIVPARGRAPLLITLVTLAVVGAAYYSYYRRQAEYFSGRNLRLLSMLTAQIEGRVEMYSGFVRTPNTAITELETIPSCSPDNHSGALRRELLDSGKGWNVVLQLPSPSRQSAPTGPCSVVPLDSVLRPVFARRIGAAFDILVVARDDGLVLYSTRQAPNASTLLHREEEWIDEQAEEPHIGETKGPPAAADSGAQAAAERESASTVMLANLRGLLRVKG